MSNLQSQLKKLLSDPAKVRKLKSADGRNVEEILESQAKRLRSLILDEMQKAMLPEENWYKRTGAFMRSLDDNLKIDTATNTISIGFLPELAYHESYFSRLDPTYHNPQFVPGALEEGFRLLYSQRRYTAKRFMEKAISRYCDSKPAWIKVRLTKTYDGNTFYDEYL